MGIRVNIEYDNKRKNICAHYEWSRPLPKILSLCLHLFQLRSRSTVFTGWFRGEMLKRNLFLARHSSSS